MRALTDSLARSSLLEACFAVEGRIVQRSGETRGRAELAEMIEGFAADPQWLRVRITSAIDAVGTTFRFRAAIRRASLYWSSSAGSNA